MRSRRTVTSTATKTPLHHLGAQLVNSLVQGQASLITPWQAVSREPDEHALSLLSGPTKKTAVATHFFKFLRPGMQRVETSDPDDRFAVVAFNGMLSWSSSF